MHHSLSKLTAFLLPFLLSPVLLCCDVSVYFSPSREVLDALLEELDSAEKSVLVCVYTFTSRKLAYSLVNARQRGVDVRVIVDKKSNENNQFAKAGFLMSNGIKVKIISGLKASSPRDWDGIMHNKFAIIDSSTLVTGSMNWTASAVAKNYENLLIMKSCPVSRKYLEEFERLWQQEE